MAQEKSFPIYEKNHASGNVGFRVDMGVVSGKRVYKSFPTRQAAEKFQIKCRAVEASKRPVELHDLNEVLRHEVLAALARLRDHNATITEAVDYYLKHARPANANATIGDVMEKFRREKQRAKMSAKYINTAWASFFVPFRDHFKNGEVSDLTSDQCADYIHKSKTWSDTTRRSHLRHLNVLFNFAKDNGFIGSNPFDNVQQPKKPPSTSKRRVVSVDNVIKLLRFALDNGYKQECAALVLILFCGVRVDEVSRLVWEDLHLDADNPVVVLGEEQTKTGKSRINDIPGNALEWLLLLRGKGKIVPPNYETRMRYLRQKADAGFKQNSARICFASYHLMQFKDAPKTAFMLGHDNPKLLYNTYRALVTTEQAARYWKITPEYTGEDVVTTVTDEQIQAVRAAGIVRALNR